jgi:hypothetical protein
MRICTIVAEWVSYLADPLDLAVHGNFGVTLVVASGITQRILDISSYFAP